ncbi:hypothetical protein JHX96_03375 [Staphylococcus saccharolyticus]|uniref:hypothetical protein n=1 Tax=Staphylococcus saccharolyticus TaxID=33028 RepID=UPI00102D98CE|nr:hypothetical protein [Staphylococcus saccharolyticus]MBL7573119.1 hypothetical protein [Staphylococcus saccharolyticus]MBL7583947.1 hypothetical protein [Staphylococcus saccharolyticus]MBL7638734.1 hypothetical protein [Staphylococcus saccharolyticus]QRJ67775.1 hypothetical protein DMB75_007105 [Staphylococcus saccharolyticus]TAA93645.1 hypothetical protein DMB74_03395 [Staphylococcus saccharolyticus]
MRIARSYGHVVNVVLNDNNKLYGDVISFENPYESDTGNFVMDLETEVGIYSFDDSEIKEIRIIS